MSKKYIVELSEAEQKSLKKLTKTGKNAAYKINHGRILLMADINQTNRGWSDEAIASALGISTSTIGRVRRCFVELGIDAALNYRTGRGRKQRCLDGDGEARLIALSCSKPPSGKEKSGNFTAGVGRQYIGEIGKTDNGNVVVTTHLYDEKKAALQF